MREFLNSFQKLEFDKVKKHIEKYSLSDLGREHIDNLRSSSDLQIIRSNLRLVSEMKVLMESDDAIPVENLFDIRNSLQRSTIENFILPADEIYRIGIILNTSKTISIYFSRRESLYPHLFSKVRDIQLDKILEYNIHRAIDDKGEVKDSASKELAKIRHEIIGKNNSLRKNLGSILKSISEKDWSQEDIITTRDSRMVIPVKVEHKNRVPGFIHSASSSGATVFIEPTETLELNNEIRTLIIQEQKEVERILKDLTDQIRGAKERIYRNTLILGELDFIRAKALYSIETIGSEPRIDDRGEIRLLNAYHPILLQRHKKKDVIPLDMIVKDDFSTIVITGPNAGGKSVAMKTFGLLSVLAQSGCHIPASPESELRIFSDIFVDMGDEQSIENDLSSFSSHLNNLKFILETVNPTSLVLIDEIGSGTDPIEGSSLAAAVLERLTQIGSLNIVTTHHGTLKSFAFETPRMLNAAMEFDQETLKPTYRFRAGVPGSSYAIEMAERIHMPHFIIERSRSIKGEDATRIEHLIIDLEKQSQELKFNLDVVNEEKKKLSSLNVVYQNKITSLEKDVKQIKAHAVDEAKQIVSQANAVIEKTIREIKETKADRKVIKEAREEIKEVVREYTSMLENADEYYKGAGLKLGDMIRLRKGNLTGEISSILDGDYYIVLSGDLKIKVHRSDISSKVEPDERVQKIVQRDAPDEKDVNREIDIRGMYGDEAITIVDKFIDDAIVAGLHRVDIIHGKGTGALRKRIGEFLKKRVSIKSIRLGEWNEGGTGVTVVEIE